MFASLRTKILGTQVLALTSTVLLLGTISYFLMTHALLSLQQHNLEHLAETSARDIGRNMSDLQHKFSNIVSSRDLHRGSDLPLAKYLDKHVDRFPELTLLNQNGHEELRLVRQRVISPNELRDWSDSDLFHKAMSKPNDVIISPASYHQEFGTPAVTFAMAQVQYFGDEFQGLMIGSVPLRRLVVPHGAREVAHLVLAVEQVSKALELVKDDEIGLERVHTRPREQRSQITDQNESPAPEVFR